MPYTLPQYNIKVRAWTSNITSEPPRVTDVDALLAWGKRVNVPSTGGTGSVGVPLSTMQLLLPSTADIRGRASTTGRDAIEIPQGSGRYYVVEVVDFMGYGFPNEHKCAIVTQREPFKTPDVS